MSHHVTSPEEFFGFQLGSDRKIARWDRIVEYFGRLRSESDRIRVVDMGPSTEGNPFLLVVISSPGNLRNLEALRQNNLKLADPRGLSRGEIDALVTEGKAVVCQSMSLHASEIGGTQMAPELAYDLLSHSDEETLRILGNVVFLMVPCFNPDGQIMVTDWYNQWLGTEYEGCELPWLYHKYSGHDNNRDAFQTNLAESKYMASILFTDWKPQAYVDHHHFGSYGPRFYVPPYCEPIHPHADPLIWREHSWYGGHIAYKLEEAGRTGVENGITFSGWGHLGFHWITAYHNIAGMLTESASARLATPLYVHQSQLKGDWRGGMPIYEPQTNFPNPWPGGWWRLRDIVEQQKISAWAVLDLAARHRETVLSNAAQKALRQTAAGASSLPRGYVIPRDQHDRLTASKLVEKLLAQGLELYVGTEPMMVGERRYDSGTVVVPLAQPKSGLIKTLLGRTVFPDNHWTRARDGTPMNPYDTATDTMAEFMGVRVEEANEYPSGRLVEFMPQEWRPAGAVSETGLYGYALDCRLNDAYAAVNRLLAAGVPVLRSTVPVKAGGGVLPPGAFLVPSAPAGLLSDLASELHLEFQALDAAAGEARPVRLLRTGVYQGYWHGFTDEGWTRLVLEQFGFPYATIRDAEIQQGNLNERLDVVLLPAAPAWLITGENVEEQFAKEMPGWELPQFPPEYRSGVGEQGAKSLKEFVEKGGTLITVGRACEVAVEKFGLRVRNAVADLSKKDFHCPGSTLRARFDITHPAAYGMPKEALVLFWESLAFEILPSPFNERYEVVASYPESDMLQSGLLIGEAYLRRKAAMVVARLGEGRVVLIGFRAQHRAQTHGTYKVLFNALLGC